MIKITNLSKKYRDASEFAVKDLNLELRPGEIFGFLGPNGSGKSTTIKCLVGILPFEKGEISICNYNIQNNPTQAKMLMGYVPDNHAVFERLTGREYVNHIANLYNVPEDVREERAEKYLKIFKLKKAFDQQIKSYSHGMKQKIAVIATLIHNPRLWILDEPLMGLDPQSSYQLKKVMREHAKSGNTVFFSSHIIDVVQNLCDRVSIIDHGKMKGLYELKDLQNRKESLEEMFMSVIDEDEDGDVAA